MGKLEDTVWEEGGRRTEQLFGVESFSFHSLVFLTNVATSVCSDLPATGIDECLPKKEGGRCMSCTFAHADLETAAAQLTASGAQQNV